MRRKNAGKIYGRIAIDPDVSENGEPSYGRWPPDRSRIGITLPAIKEQINGLEARLVMIFKHKYAMQPDMNDAEDAGMELKIC